MARSSIACAAAWAASYSHRHSSRLSTQIREDKQRSTRPITPERATQRRAKGCGISTRRPTCGGMQARTHTGVEFLLTGIENAACFACFSCSTCAYAQDTRYNSQRARKSAQIRRYSISDRVSAAIGVTITLARDTEARYPDPTGRDTQSMHRIGRQSGYQFVFAGLQSGVLSRFGSPRLGTVSTKVAGNTGQRERMQARSRGRRADRQNSRAPHARIGPAGISRAPSPSQMGTQTPRYEDWEGKETAALRQKRAYVSVHEEVSPRAFFSARANTRPDWSARPSHDENVTRLSTTADHRKATMLRVWLRASGRGGARHKDKGNAREQMVRPHNRIVKLPTSGVGDQFDFVRQRSHPLLAILQHTVQHAAESIISSRTTAEHTQTSQLVHPNCNWRAEKRARAWHASSRMRARALRLRLLVSRSLSAIFARASCAQAHRARGSRSPCSIGRK